MFRSRSSRRSSSAASGRYDPNAYAAAAAHATVKQSNSNASLSAAAAAAALRSAAGTPTQAVGDIQTKRMLRRGSTASNASNASNGRPLGGMQRRTSSGSMTERTFRSPSPGPGNRSRPSSAAGWAPPVPAMPKNIPDVPVKSQKRAPSLDPPMARITSPEPAQNVRNTSVDRNSNLPAARRGSVRAPSLSRVPEGQERDVPINFSRPMSPEGRPMSRQFLVRIPEPMDAESDGGTPGRASSTNRLSIQAQVKIAARERQAALARGLPPPAKPMIPAALAALTAGRPSSAAAQRPQPRPASAQGRPITGPPPTAFRAPIRSASVQGRSVSDGRPMSAMALRTPSNTQVGERPMSPTTTIMHAGLPEPLPQSNYTTRPVTGSRQRPRSGTAPSGPSQEQIKGFQDKAALHLARPRPQMPSAPPSSSRTYTLSPNDGQLKRASSSAGAAALIAAGARPHSRSASQPIGQLTTPGGSRAPSASPARSARFAELPLPAVRHQPPPRSVSPSKPSLRGYSPAESARVPTNASSVSLISEDGITKKKRGKVGFSEVPIVLGETPKPTTFVNGNGAPTFPNDYDSSTMGSRPALPSFDSVRSRKEGKFSVLAEGSQQSRTIHTVSGSTPFPSMDTTNEALGTSIARMNATAAPYHTTTSAVSGASQPTGNVDEYSAMLDRINESTNGVHKETASSELPVHALSDYGDIRQATTVDGAGFDSSVTSPQSVLSRIFGGSAQPQPYAQPMAQRAYGVPAISVLPASPSLDQGDGAFSHYETDSRAMLHNGEAFHPGENTHADTDASSYYEEIPRPAYNHNLAEEEEGRASEETAEMDEPAGFASLDAIVESPGAEEPAGGHIAGSKMVLPTGVAGAVSPLGSKSPEEDWAKIKAYWSGLSEQRKQQIESGGPADETAQREVQNQRQLQPQTQNYGVQPQNYARGQENAPLRNGPQGQYVPNRGQYVQGPPPQQKPPAKVPIKSAMKPGTNRVDGPINPDPVPLPPWPDQEYQQSARLRNTTMRTSMRPEQERNNSGDGSQRKGMRMSMRGANEELDNARATGNQRMTAQRAAGGFAAQRMAEVPPSQPSGPSDAAVALARKQMQTIAMQRTKSNDSDSDSSFKRNKRRREKANEGRYNMKRSMRDRAQADARPSSPTPGRSSRIGMRSPSPEESAARNPLRGFRAGSIDSSAPKESKGFGFGRKSKPIAEEPQSAFQSRFNDSDDEDVGRPTPFGRSRIVDSDDEGSPAQTRSTPGRGQAGDNGADGVSSPSTDKKGIRGMFAMGKKRNTPFDNVATNGSPAAESSPARRSILGGMTGSPSKPGDLLRRLSTSQSTPTSAPVTPKKQIVTGPGSANEWPFLPPPIPENYGTEYPGASRPETSDGAVSKDARPAMGASKDSTMSAAGAGAKLQRPPIVSRKSGKKKRFQGLRRVFGIHD